MTYQDIWANGELKKRGYRECGTRYELIKDFCSTFKTPFSVCDIGANMLYFSIRLVEDFGCSVVAFECDHFQMRKKHLESSGAESHVMLLNHRIELDNLHVMRSSMDFDLVLALSVLHHVPRNQYEFWIEGLSLLGKYLILELSDRDIPPNGKILGYTKVSHKKEPERPMVVVTR